MFHIDHPGGGNTGFYRIGWDLDAAGIVTGGWTAPIPIPGWFGTENQGGGIAVADIRGNGRRDLVVFHIDHPGGGNAGFYRIGWDLDLQGIVTGGWTAPHPRPRLVRPPRPKAPGSPWRTSTAMPCSSSSSAMSITPLGRRRRRRYMIFRRIR